MAQHSACLTRMRRARRAAYLASARGERLEEREDVELEERVEGGGEERDAPDGLEEGVLHDLEAERRCERAEDGILVEGRLPRVVVGVVAAKAHDEVARQLAPSHVPAAREGGVAERPDERRRARAWVGLEGWLGSEERAGRVGSGAGTAG